MKVRREMERVLEAILRRDAELAESVVELDGMRAFLDPRIPDVEDASWLLVERPGIPIDEILAAADETIGAAGMHHRTLFAYDDADAERLVAALEPRGWDVERGVYMLLRGEPDRPADPRIEVQRAQLDELLDARVEVLREELADDYPRGVPEKVLEQYLEFDRTIGLICGDDWFVIRDGHRVASMCRLMSHRGTGQVENVATLADARNRGYARAVVLAAVEASRAAGHVLTYLGALADDWPRRLYARLGFDVVGDETVLYRKPER